MADGPVPRRLPLGSLGKLRPAVRHGCQVPEAVHKSPLRCKPASGVFSVLQIGARIRLNHRATLQPVASTPGQDQRWCFPSNLPVARCNGIRQFDEVAGRATTCSGGRKGREITGRKRLQMARRLVCESRQGTEGLSSRRGRPREIGTTDGAASPAGTGDGADED